MTLLQIHRISTYTFIRERVDMEKLKGWTGEWARGLKTIRKMTEFQIQFVKVYGLMNINVSNKGKITALKLVSLTFFSPKGCGHSCVAQNAHHTTMHQFTCVFFMWNPIKKKCDIIMAKNRQKKTKVCIQKKASVVSGRCSPVNKPSISLHDWALCVD
eukprot:TRINITY_DN11053_c0_g1_i1.p1 TRINITY_DN11053_c0_g1~~TRINITY_DN11053_c0_g1_i1.p1  ORF type:complete len:158 (-),score=17.65 TRINITY_DN11053_c0_g1_i1:617-1090(-)